MFFEIVYNCRLELKLLFETFLQKLTSELSEKQYKLIYIEKIDGQKEYMALFLKDESPILSFVSVVNFGIDGVIDGYTEKLNGIMEELLNDNKEFFNNAVCVNILYSNCVDGVKKFADSMGNLRDSNIHNIWWYTDGNIVGYGCGQPSKILGIEKYVKNALDSDFYEPNRNIEDINKMKNQLSALRSEGKFPIVMTAILAADIFVFLIQTIFGLENNFILKYGINGDMIFYGGQYYRLITYMFIHSGWEHIAFNCISLYIYGTRTEKYFGKVGFFVIYFLSGMLGGILSAALNGGYAVGASGAIFGLIGAVLILSKMKRQNIDGLGYMTMLIIAVSSIGMGMMTANVDNFGHIGGFIGGIIIGYAACRLKKE